MNIIIFLLLFFSIILESTLISFPITLVIICVLSLVLRERAGFWAFIFGLILDLFLIQALGLSSLLFIFVVLIASSVYKKVLIVNSLYAIVFIAGISLVYSLVFLRSLDLGIILKSVVFGVVLMLLFSKIFPSFLEDRRKLSL